MATHQHPYVPADVVLPGFHPSVMNVPHMLGMFFGLVAVIVGALLVWTGGKKYLSGLDKFMLSWFVCSGLIHLFVEGNVVLNNKFYQDTTGNFLNEIWREYAKADSRYATRDAFTIQMEGVTAFAWGPMCLLIAYGIVARKAWRFFAMTVVSVGQFYGTVLYFTTCFHVGLETHTRPEPLYFWFYFVFMNVIWLVIPGGIIAHCGITINNAVAGAMENKVKAN